MKKMKSWLQNSRLFIFYILFILLLKQACVSCKYVKFWLIPKIKTTFGILAPFCDNLLDHLNLNLSIFGYT